MNAAPGAMLYTFDSILTASNDVKGSVPKINESFESLRTYLAPIIASWEGTASTDYQALQRRWDLAAGDLRDVLNQIGDFLLRAYESSRRTEQAATSTWAV